MPRLPGLDPGGIDRASRGPAQLGRRASPGDFAQVQGQLALGERVRDMGEAQQHLYGVAMTQRVNERLVAASNDLPRLEAESSADPDYAGREELYRTGAEAIKKHLTDGLIGSYADEFGAQFEALQMHGETRVRAGARSDLLDVYRTTLDAAERDLGTQAARLHGAERNLYTGRFGAMVDQGVTDGLISRQDGAARKRSFHDGLTTADQLRLIRENPVAAWQMLEDPEQSPDMDPVVREQWRDRAFRGIQAMGRAEESRRNAVAKAEKEAQKEQVRLIQQQAEGLAVAGTPEAHGALETYMNGPEGRELPIADQRYYREVIRAGGPPVTRTNRQTYSTLEALSRRDFELEQMQHDVGTTFEDLVQQAWVRRELSQADRDSLLDANQDHRFDGALEFIENSFSEGLVTQATPGMRQARTTAISEFRQQKALPENAAMTRRESMVLAKEIVREVSGGLSKANEESAWRRQRPETLRFTPEGQIDMQETIKASRARFVPQEILRSGDPERIRHAILTNPAANRAIAQARALFERGFVHEQAK